MAEASPAGISESPQRIAVAEQRQYRAGVGGPLIGRVLRTIAEADMRGF